MSYQQLTTLTIYLKTSRFNNKQRIYLIRSEGLFHVSVLEELGNGENIGPSVHEDEEENSS